MPGIVEPDLKIKAFLLSILLGMTAGCSTLSNAPKFSEVQQSPAGDAAVVTVFRTEENSLYLLRSAPVYVNRTDAVSLPRGAFHTYALSPGHYRFLTKTFDANSECVLDVDLKPGGEYFLEVVPNTEAAMQLMADGFIWLAKVSVTQQITSLSVGEYNQSCQGMFAFIPTPKEVAMEKLPELRQVE